MAAGKAAALPIRVRVKAAAAKADLRLDMFVAPGAFRNRALDNPPGNCLVANSNVYRT